MARELLDVLSRKVAVALAIALAYSIKTSALHSDRPMLNRPMLSMASYAGGIGTGGEGYLYAASAVRDRKKRRIGPETSDHEGRDLLEVFRSWF